MKNSNIIKEVIRKVRMQDDLELVTNNTPTMKDVLSTNLLWKIISSSNEKEGINLKKLKEKFPSAAKWLEEIQESPDWKLMLQDYLLLAKFQKTGKR